PAASLFCMVSVPRAPELTTRAALRSRRLPISNLTSRVHSWATCIAFATTWCSKASRASSLTGRCLVVRLRAFATASMGIVIGPRREHGADHDLEIEPERPVIDVVQVVRDAAAHLVVGVGLAAQPVNLRPAGDAGLDVVAAGIDRDSLLELAIVRERM